MRPSAAATIATRVIALYFGINVVVFFVSSLATGFGDAIDDRHFWAYVLTNAVILTGVWVGAVMIGSAMTRGVPDETPRAAAGSILEGVAFTVIGLWLAVEAVITLVVQTSTQEGTFFGPGFGPGFGYVLSTTTGNVVKLFIGIGLLAGGHALASLLSGWRGAAKKMPPPGAQTPPQDDPSM